ncbi:MAG: hypothetical protein GC185_10910 [Alphaproteobacteria bacterium]|nr:hypothetical protein [Alphaproteobacteria bacterium]
MSRKIRKRKVFYLSGFDPRGGDFYYNLYRDEALKQSGRAGVPITVGASGKTGEHCSQWNIVCADDDTTVETDYCFLHWEDIIKKHWFLKPRELIAGFAQYFWRYMASGAFLKILKRAPLMAHTIIFPIEYLLLSLVISVRAGAYIGENPGFHAATAGLLAVLAGTSLYAVALLLGRRFKIFWLARIFIYCGNYPSRPAGDDIDLRAAAFAEQIARAVADDLHDEYLIVGHSLGSIMLIDVLGHLLRKHPGIAAGDKLCVLTLGHCIPLVSLFPKAGKFREDLRLAASAGLRWVDASSPVDAVCFGRVSPFLGIEAAERKSHITMLPPRFHRMFARHEYIKILLNMFRLHFQYLMASDLDAEYDYFKITAGAQRLHDRFVPPPRSA